MRSSLLATLWCLCAIIPAGAAAPAAPPVPLLWKACDADNCLYLLGSFHFLKPSDYPLSADVEAAFADAERLVFEVPPQEMDSPALQRRIRAAAVRRDGRRLDDELAPAQDARLSAWIHSNQAVLAEMGIDRAGFQSLRPWYAGLIVTVVGLETAGMQPQLGMDRYFGNRAVDAGKPASGLESGASQIALLSGMTPEEQRQMLEEALDSAGRGDAEIIALHDAWRRGDIQALAEGTLVGLRRDYPRLYKAINADRNAAWVSDLEARLSTPGTDDHLVIVGAMHLLGSDGLVERLRAKGHRVERICSVCVAMPDGKPD